MSGSDLETLEMENSDVILGDGMIHKATLAGILSL